MHYIKLDRADQLPEELNTVVREAQRKNQTVVLATGAFDLLHDEHKRFLQLASQVGDMLLVGIESDRRVGILKGEGRPVQDEAKRWQQVVALPPVTMAFVLPDHFDNREDYLGLIMTIRPHILAVSSHTPHLDRKQALMTLVGGEVKVVHQHNPNISTTQLLQKDQSHSPRKSVL